MIVLDASVLVALVNADDSHHAWAVDFFTQTVAEDLCMSTLTLAEVLVHPTRRGVDAAFMANIAGLDLKVTPLEAESSSALAAVRSKSGLKMPDAAVLHTALAQAAALATLDDQLAAQARNYNLRVYTA